mgnify:CR=1 FL=1
MNKLTELQKEQIIQRYTVGNESPVLLAKEYGVTRQSIYNVINKVDIKRVRVIEGGATCKLAK